MSTTALAIVAPAEVYPITVADAKGHLKITHSLEDAHISNLIAAATAWAQDHTSRILVATQVTFSFDRFPQNGEAAWLRGDHFHDVYYIPASVFSRPMDASARNRSMLLPGGYVSAVYDISYTDVDGNPQTLTGPTSDTPGTDYQEDLTDDEWPQIFPARESDWPGVQSGLINAAQVDYLVGWADETEVPDNIKQAIRFKLGDLYTIRDTADAGSKSKLLTAAEDLLFPYVVQMV